MRLSGKHILLGVTGGIAAYKAAVLLRQLQKEGAEVRVAMTPAATRFLGVDTMAALSRSAVATDWFPSGDEMSQTWSRHIHWAEWADALVVAPCTANTLADIAHGKAENPLGALALAARCPIFIAPTMDGGMYRNPAIVRNLQTVRDYGYHVIDPESGYLASGLIDTGRLPEPETITDRIVSVLNAAGNRFLAGKKVLVSAGPTREYIDAVRFMSNPSTGKMGFAMAEAARDAGAQVVLVHGPVSLAKPEGVETVSVTSALDMLAAVQSHADADVVVMSAAVSDFRAKQRFDHKVSKVDAGLTIEFEPNPDILATLGKSKREGQILIGFAMETGDLANRAMEKLRKKNLDAILANALNEPGAGFAADTNVIHCFDHDGETVFKGPKKQIARDILKHLLLGDSAL